MSNIVSKAFYVVIGAAMVLWCYVIMTAPSPFVREPCPPCPVAIPDPSAARLADRADEAERRLDVQEKRLDRLADKVVECR